MVEQQQAARTTVKWVNSHLPEGQGIGSLDDLADGTKLLDLMLALFGPSSSSSSSESGSSSSSSITATLPTMCSAATVQQQQQERHRRASSAQLQTFVSLETLVQAFAVARDAGVPFKFIAPEDFAERNTKMVLAFLFAVALRYNLVSGSSSQQPQSQQHRPAEESTSDALLAWVRGRIAGPPYGVAVGNFGQSWVDGRAFHALLHSAEDPASRRPWTAVAAGNSSADAAFRQATTQLGLAPLLDAQQDLDPRCPNTQGIATYVSEMCRLIRATEARRAAAAAAPPKPPTVAAPKPPTAAAAAAAAAPRMVSEAEYERVRRELVSTQRRVGELEAELLATRTAPMRRATATAATGRAVDDDASSSEDEDEGALAATTMPSQEEEALRRMGETHTSEHRRVQKMREQLRRAIERVEELAEAAKEDEEAVESLPEELGWLLDVIQEKEKEAASAATVMAQLEQQMATASAASPGSRGVFCPMTEQEKAEVDGLLREAAEEEHRVLGNVEQVLAGLANDLRGKPIAEDVDRLRKLAAIGASRAQRALTFSGPAARSPDSSLGATLPAQRPAAAAEPARQISRTLPARPTTSSAVGITVVPPKKPTAPAPAATAAHKPSTPTAPTVAAPVQDNGEVVSVPVVVEQLGVLEQRLEGEPVHQSRISALRKKAKEGWKKAKTKIGDALHIKKSAERRETAKTKAEAPAASSMAMVPDGGERAAKLRAAIRQAVVELNPSGSQPSPKPDADDALIARLGSEVRSVKATLEQKSEAIAALQASLVDAQTKVWERVKQLKKH